MTPGEEDDEAGTKDQCCSAADYGGISFFIALPLTLCDPVRTCTLPLTCTRVYMFTLTLDLT